MDRFIITTMKTILVIVIILLIATVVTRCSYSVKCINCGETLSTDITIPTSPRAIPYICCPKCGNELKNNMEIHNNLGLILGQEEWEQVKNN